ncbi:hypothetical protein COCNU_14G012480 [Cocos nucifera]|uniref:Uncharacterized protein n=1 Tax=Cocos nucifera TaxID=13894 RepID=A0A8K0IWF5_COCNU|nr:hypothetical protein COCNU_14G012480 [Cocos nucifera]
MTRSLKVSINILSPSSLAFSLKELSSSLEKKKEKKRRVILSPSPKAVTAKGVITKVEVAMTEAIKSDAVEAMVEAYVELLGATIVPSQSDGENHQLRYCLQVVEEKRDKIKEGLAMERSRSNAVKMAFRKNKVFLKEIKKNLQIKKAQLQESEVEPAQAPLGMCHRLEFRMAFSLSGLKDHGTILIGPSLGTINGSSLVEAKAGTQLAGVDGGLPDAESLQDALGVQHIGAEAQVEAIGSFAMPMLRVLDARTTPSSAVESAVHGTMVENSFTTATKGSSTMGARSPTTSDGT